MIQPERIRPLNEKPSAKGDFVLYWMQASQRTEYNHALEYAILCANENKQRLVVFFGLTDHYPSANQRHYAFMLRGLKEVESSLRRRKIPLVIHHAEPHEGVLKLAPRASLLICDAGCTAVQTAWRNHVARKAPCTLVQVETDCVVPVEAASEKENFSAGTLRPRIHRRLDEFLVPLETVALKKDSLSLACDSLDISDPDALLKTLDIDRSVPVVETFLGGTSQARSHLKTFIEKKLTKYDALRNDPAQDYQSNMSPYLHFGQISPLYIALEVQKSKKPGRDAYLEELIVRRELAQNFVFYSENYDNIDCLPAWAKTTLEFHKKDKRQYTYSRSQFEKAQTHDPYWNAAQREMRLTGKMHGYMRMYWGKKILEWSDDPAKAWQIAVYLNDKYELDGRDPNGYAGVAWCFGKHDRAWPRRPIFGKVRYMAESGLKRKFSIDKYIEKIDALEKALA